MHRDTEKGTDRGHKSTLTWDEAFLVFVHALRRYDGAQEGITDVANMLSDIIIYDDGITGDPAAESDWDDWVYESLQSGEIPIDSRSSHGGQKLSIEESLRAAAKFMSRYNGTVKLRDVLLECSTDTEFEIIPADLKTDWYQACADPDYDEAYWRELEEDRASES